MNDIDFTSREVTLACAEYFASILEEDTEFKLEPCIIEEDE